MRSIIKLPGLALVALLGVSLLTACGPTETPSFNASDISCEDVSAELKAAKADLKASEKEFKEVAGTPAEVLISNDITATTAKIDALKDRSSECAGEDVTATTASTKECSASWKMEKSVVFDNNYWFEDGIIEIKNATTDEDAVKASRVWLDRVRKEPVKLVGAIGVFLKEEVDKSKLIDSDGCASDKAMEYVIELRLVLTTAQVTIEAAPDGGHNSGMNDQGVVFDPEPGVGGDRTAIKIILPDGTVVWIMAKCGNLVTPGLPPNVPQGKIQRENIGSNPLVPDFWQDTDGDWHTVNNNNGAEDAQGNQGTLADVAAAQEAAAAQAAADNAAAEAAAEAARAAAEAEVEEEQELPPAEAPVW